MRRRKFGRECKSVAVRFKGVGSDMTRSAELLEDVQSGREFENVSACSAIPLL